MGLRQGFLARSCSGVRVSRLRPGPAGAVAGRCISTDRTVNGSVRVMPVCLSTGEAAGIAAAQAAAGDADVHRVDVAAVRARLRAGGAYLPEG